MINNTDQLHMKRGNAISYRIYDDHEQACNMINNTDRLHVKAVTDISCGIYDGNGKAFSNTLNKLM